MSRLSIDAVHFGYGAEPVLSGVGFSVEPGSVVALVGPNGAGKSTLLRVAAGILAPARGRVLLADRDLAYIPRRELARDLAYVPQEFQPAFPFRAGELVLMGRYAHRGFARLETAADLVAAESAMTRADVWTLRNRRYDELSGGERRRVLLAQAFCQASALLLLDEPTAALDPAHALSLFETLGVERERRGTSVLAATHDLNLAARYADRVIVLAEGAIVADGMPREVLAGPAAAAAFGTSLHVGTLPSGQAFVVPGEVVRPREPARQPGEVVR